jgi:hypothetical protein
MNKRASFLGEPKGVVVNSNELLELENCFRGYALAREGSNSVSLPTELAVWRTQNAKNIATKTTEIRGVYRMLSNEAQSIHAIYKQHATDVKGEDGNIVMDASGVQPQKQVNGNFWVIEDEKIMADYKKAIEDFNFEAKVKELNDKYEKIDLLIYPIDKNKLDKLKGATIIGEDQNGQPIEPDYSVMYKFIAQ